MGEPRLEKLVKLRIQFIRNGRKSFQIPKSGGYSVRPASAAKARRVSGSRATLIKRTTKGQLMGRTNVQDPISPAAARVVT